MPVLGTETSGVMTDLVTLEAGIATTTSLRVADGTENEHASVIRLIRDNIEDFEEYGRVGFEIAPFATPGGVQRREVATLNEEQATLLMTYMRNNPVVKDFKRRLVREFYQMRSQLVAPLSDEELIHRALTVSARRVAELTERVAELEPQAQVATMLLDADGDLSVRDAAQSLTRAGIKVGERRLFSELSRRGWIKRALGDGRYRVIQSAIESGYMSVLPQSHYHPKTGVLVLDPPQPRVTPKGLQRLLSDYGDAS